MRRPFAFVLVTALLFALLPTPLHAQTGTGRDVFLPLVTNRYANTVQASATAATPTELFISEYIEGSSNNKAIEIYNGTGTAVDLAAGGYNVQMHFNGNASAGLTLNLTGTVADGDVYVLAQSAAGTAILAQADQTNGAGWFNGDDAVVLRKGTTIIDAFGRIGFDPGSEWGGSGSIGTADETLRRKATVCAGDTDGTNPFDPSQEWDGFPTNTFDGLGAHTVNCSPTLPPSQPLPVAQTFDDCTLTGWTIFSVDTDTQNTWSCNSAFSNIEANGFGDSVPADEWLITPPLNLDAQGNDTLSFRSQTSFTDSVQPYPQLSVLYSTDYQEGDPTAAGWTPLTGITFSPENSGAWTDSGLIDLSAISGDRVHFAFRYQSSGTGSGTAARWRLDSISFAEYIPPLSCTDDSTITSIHVVQGSGATTLLLGSEVIIDGVIVGDFQNNGSADNGDLNGFYVQEEDAHADADPATSEGIFVYAPGLATDVTVGQHVRVRGNAVEYSTSGGASLMTQLAFTELAVCAEPAPMPTATEILLPVDSLDALERYEGMLVTFPQALVISEYFNFDRFGEIVLTPTPSSSANTSTSTASARSS